MQLLDLTLKTPEENLALDEALLEQAEAEPAAGQTLRLWESPVPLVVIGRGSKIDTEVHRDYCRREGIPVLRRTSGGCAIVGGPGCLMYSLILSIEEHDRLGAIGAAHAYVLEKLSQAMGRHVDGVARRGTSDLAVDGIKVSGNSLQVKRDHLLYHGTLLYDFPLPLIAKCLPPPPRAPEYRENRDHREFVTNLPLCAAKLREVLVECFAATEIRTSWPKERVAELVAEKYSREEWNARR